MCIASIKKHTVILGGGITGLSTAHFLSLKNKDFIVLEKNIRPGGNISSERKNDFLIENGPNTVLLNNASVITLIKAYGLWDKMSVPQETAENNRYVLLNNELQLLPRNAKEFFTSPLLKWKDKLRLLKEPFVKKHSANTSAAEFVRHRFGEGILNQFVEPFMTGIYSGKPEYMSAKHTLRLLWDAEQEYGSVIKGMLKKERKPKAKMFNFPNGLSQLTDAIAKELNTYIEYDCNINSIEKIDEGYRIISDKKEIFCQKIISTLPAYALNNYISDSHLKHELQKVEYVPIDVFHFGFNKKDIKNQSQGFGVLTKSSDKKHFLGILFNSRIFSHTAPKGKELFTVIVGGSKQRELCQLKAPELKSIILKELTDLMKCEGKAVFSNHYKYEKGIPQYDLNHQSLVDALENFEKNNPNFHILGNYFNGISVSDSILKANNFISSTY